MFVHLRTHTPDTLAHTDVHLNTHSHQCIHTCVHMHTYTHTVWKRKRVWFHRLSETKFLFILELASVSKFSPPWSSPGIPILLTGRKGEKDEFPIL